MRLPNQARKSSNTLNCSPRASSVVGGTWFSVTQKPQGFRTTSKPSEVAGLAVFLASPAGAYITGSTVTIDGGLSLELGQGA
jgi:NAD(P)-dependent dehydrogenase (short-subunit alcohol dehydrogenase family)